MGQVYDLSDGFRSSMAHNAIGGASNHENGCVDLLPAFSQVERLQLLVEGCGAPVLPVGRVVPETLPFRMLGDHFGRRFAILRQTTTLEVEHVLVPGAAPGTGGDVSANRMLAGN